MNLKQLTTFAALLMVATCLAPLRSAAQDTTFKSKQQAELIIPRPAFQPVPSMSTSGAAALDTIDTADPFIKILLFSDYTWKYYKEYDAPSEDRNIITKLLFEGASQITAVYVNDSCVHICNKCGNRTHINNKYTVNLKHLRITGKYTCISFVRKQYRCISCSETESGEVDFKANGYRITKHLYNYIFDLLAFKQFTYRDVSVLTGLGQNTIKSIYSDREQKYPKLPLHNHYMHNDEVLKKPKKYSDNILIYEDFFAHLNENVLQVVDFDTGHLIWIGFDTEKIPEIDGFLSFVGEDWMKHLKNVIVDDTIKSIDALDSRYPDLDIHVYKS